jgi:hypothetical protein
MLNVVFTVFEVLWAFFLVVCVGDRRVGCSQCTVQLEDGI